MSKCENCNIFVSVIKFILLMVFRNLKKRIAAVLACMIALAVFSSLSPSIHAEGEDGEYHLDYAPVNPYYGGWGNCTWSAWQLCYQYTGVALPRLGNAGAWYASAAAMGMAVGQTPAVNSIGVWSNHVVFVTDVSEDGTQVFMKEGGYCGGYNEGWINAMTSRNGQAFIGYIYITTSSGLPYPVTTYVDTATGETVAMPTETTVTKIEFPAVEEDVIRIDDAAKEEPVKKEDQIAMEERQKEDKEQRSLAIAAKNKQGCD